MNRIMPSNSIGIKSDRPSGITNPSLIFTAIYLLMLLFTVLRPSADISSKYNTVLMALRAEITNNGIIVHLLSIVFFLMGGLSAEYLFKFKSVEINRFYVVKRRRLIYIVYFYCFTSLAIVLLQIYLTSNITEHICAVISKSLGSNDKYFSPAFYRSYSKGGGGLPGIIKMFNYLPLSGLYLILTYGYLKHRNILLSKREIIVWKHVFFIIIVSLFRTSLFLDKTFLMAIFTAILYFYILTKLRVRSLKGVCKIVIVTILALCISFTFADLSSYGREGMRFYDTILIYSSLGLANLSLSLKSTYDLTYGLSTFGFARPILDIFGFSEFFINLKAPEYVWGLPTYLTNYVYNDFRWFYSICFFLFGYFATFIYLKMWKNIGKYDVTIMLSLIIVIATSFVVPVNIWLEWWVTLIMGIVGVRYCFKCKKRIKIMKIKCVGIP